MAVEAEIARSRADVWSFLCEIERAPEWLSEFESAEQESEGPPAIGTVVRYTISPGSRSGTYEIVEWVPGRRMAWDGPPLGWAGGTARPRGYFELSDAGRGHTRLVARFQPELSGAQVVLAPYLRRWLRRRRLADLETLKRLVEGDGPR